MTTLAAELIDTDPALHALAADWSALWKSTPNATPFQSPEWLMPWWRQFGTGRPRVAVLRANGGLQALLPLYVLPEERKILPIGAGITDYHDALVAPDAPPDAVDVLLHTALAGSDEICDLTDLPPSARLRDAATPAGWQSSLHSSDTCPVLPLGPDLRASIPAGQHRNIRQSSHRADALGGWTVEMATEAALPEMLQTLLRLNAARWEAIDPRVTAFHAEAAPRLLAAGSMRLTALRLRGEIAAACYTLIAPGRLLTYISGFDPVFAHQSPARSCSARSSNRRLRKVAPSCISFAAARRINLPGARMNVGI